MAWEFRVFLLTELDSWKSYYHLLPQTSVYHSPDYIKFLSRYMGFCGAELTLYGDGENFVYHPYLLQGVNDWPKLVESSRGNKYYDIISSWYYGGPLVLSNLPEVDTKALLATFSARFTDYCRERGIVSEFVRFDANFKNHRFLEGLYEVSYNRETVYADLSKSAAQLDKEMHASVHRNIRKALASGLVLAEEGGEGPLREFFWVYDEEMVRKNAPPHLRFPEEFFVDISRHPEMFRLLTIRQNGNFIGGFIICESEHHAFHYLSASRYNFWELRPNDMLFREAILSSQRYGRRIFDFQGGRAGVYKFKTKFTNTRGEFYIAKKVHHPEVFQHLCAAAGLTEAGRSFPPYRFVGL
jgi:serine/alanine adding enzyme